MTNDSSARFSPSRVLIATLIALNVAPAIVLLLFRFQENYYGAYTPSDYFAAVRLFLLSAGLFLACFWLGSFVGRGHGAKLAKGAPQRTLPPLTLRICRTLGITLLAVYMATDGLDKLSQLGSTLSAWEFRTYTVNNASRLATAAIELTRRIFLPIWVASLLARGPVGYKSNYRIQVALGAVCLLLAAASTLDRYPFMLSFALFGYVRLRQSDNMRARLMRGSVYGTAALFVAGAVSLLQRNDLAFGPSEAVSRGWTFLMGRLLTVPTQISVELAFLEFPIDAERLNLRYTRLNALFGGSYLKIGDAGATNVRPVGAVGDIWRNLGFTGLVLCGLSLGLLFGQIDRAHRAANVESQIVIEFMTIALGFYMVFGVFFSQGVFASIATVVVLGWLMRRSRAAAAPTARHPADHGRAPISG